MITGEMMQTAERALRVRETAIFQAIFLLPTLIIAGLALVELALRVWSHLG